MFQSQTRRLLPRNPTCACRAPPLALRFNRRRDACFLATLICAAEKDIMSKVSIADSTLASSQRTNNFSKRAWYCCFNRRRDACFLATVGALYTRMLGGEFQSQTRRLLPRNTTFPTRAAYRQRFQSQTRRLLPRNLHMSD